MYTTVMSMMTTSACLSLKEKPLSKSLQRGEDPQFDQVSLYYSWVSHYAVNLDGCQPQLY